MPVQSAKHERYAAMAGDPGGVDRVLAEVTSLARTFDPTLAFILGASDVLPRHAVEWSEARRSGLQSCLTKLGSIRHEALAEAESGRVGRAIAHVVLQLSRFSHSQGVSRVRPA